MIENITIFIGIVENEEAELRQLEYLINNFIGPKIGSMKEQIKHKFNKIIPPVHIMTAYSLLKRGEICIKADKTEVLGEYAAESTRGINQEEFDKINEVFKKEYGSFLNLNNEKFETISEDIVNAITILFKGVNK